MKFHDKLNEKQDNKNESIKESYRRLTKTEMEIEKLLNANGFKTSEVHQDPGKEKKIFYVNKSVKLDGMQPQGTEVSGKNFKEILRKLQNKFNKNESIKEINVDKDLTVLEETLRKAEGMKKDIKEEQEKISLKENKFKHLDRYLKSLPVNKTKYIGVDLKDKEGNIKKGLITISYEEPKRDNPTIFYNFHVDCIKNDICQDKAYASLIIDNIKDTIEEYAKRHGLEIIKTTSYSGKNESIQEDIMDGFVYTVKLPIKDKFIDYVDLYEVTNSPELIDVQFVAKNKDGNTMPIYIANGIIDSSDGKWNKYPEVKYNVYHLKDKEISNYILQNFNDFIDNRSYKLDELQKVIVEKIKELDNKMDEDIATLQDKIDQAEIDLQDLLNTVKEKSLITEKSDFEVGNIVIFKTNKDKIKYGSTLAEISSINNNILELKRLNGETIGKVSSSKVIPFDKKEKAVNENTFAKINNYLNKFQV